MNVKDQVALTKVNMAVVPPSSIIYEALALQYGAFLAPKADGTFGYGPFNWRGSPIKASVYHGAILRHELDWWDGENTAPDSLVHHLGHLKATAGILIDAIETGNLIDDRPPKGTAAALFEVFRLKAKT